MESFEFWILPLDFSATGSSYAFDQPSITELQKEFDALCVSMIPRIPPEQAMPVKTNVIQVWQIQACVEFILSKSKITTTYLYQVKGVIPKTISYLGDNKYSIDAYTCIHKPSCAYARAVFMTLLYDAANDNAALVNGKVAGHVAEEHVPQNSKNILGYDSPSAFNTTFESL